MTNIEQLYRQKVVEIYNRIALTGLPERDPRLNDIPLDKIFIKLTMAIHSAFKPAIRFEPESKASALEQEYFRRKQREEPSPEPIALATALQKYQRLFITGAPGSGKTTLLRWLAVTFANQQQAEASRLGADFTEETLPILLELRRFSQRFQSLTEKSPAPFDLAQEISAFVGADPRFHGVSEQWMRDTLAQKPCLLLIDGLDEIADQQTRQNLLEALEAFSQIPMYADVRCLLTTRPHGFRDVHLSAQFQRTEVQPFTADDVAQFIEHWYATAYAFDYQDEAQQLINAIQANQRVTEIAQNPLLCTIIAIIYRNNRVLPNRRVELYLKCCEALLDTWERNKQIKESGLIGGFDWQTKLELLMPVAYWFHEQTEQLAMPEEAVVKQLAQALDTLRQNSGLTAGNKPIEQEARDFIVAIRDRSGLLQGRGDGTLEFTHRTFQEYLAARYIAAQPDPVYIDRVMVHLHKAWWREVHLLVIGHLGSGRDNAEKAERLLLTILNVYKAPSRWLLLPNIGWWLRWFNLGENWQTYYLDKSRQASTARFLLKVSLKLNWGLWLPYLQWQKRLAWYLMREFELAAQGYADCAISAKTQTLTTTFSQFAIRRVSKWIKEPFYEAQLFFLLTILKQQALPRDAVATIFIKALQNQKQKSWVRGTAAKSLWQLGEKSQPVVNALLLTLQDQDEEVRRAAAESLGQLGEKNQKVIDTLLLALQDKDENVRGTAALSLGRLGNKSQKVIDVLLLALQDEEDWVRHAAAKSLGQLGETSPKVIDALLLALQDQESSVRFVAAESLGQLGEKNEVMRVLLLALQDKDERVRSAAKSLGQLGEKSQKVVDALLLALQDKNEDVRSTAAKSLGQLGDKSQKVIDALLLALQDKKYGVRSAAVSSLGELGEKSQPVIDALLLALQDKKYGVRRTAASSLGQLGEKSQPVIDALLLALQDKYEDVRRTAASSLGQLGEKSQPVIDALLLALQNKYEDVRDTAASSLGKLKIEEEAQLQPVLIALNRRLHDSDDVRTEAYKSLRKLLESRPIPGYRWKPFAKPKTFWQRLRESTVEKILLIILVSILLVLLGSTIPFLLQILTVIGLAFTILPPLLFPPKER